MRAWGACHHCERAGQCPASRPGSPRRRRGTPRRGAWSPAGSTQNPFRTPSPALAARSRTRRTDRRPAATPSARASLPPQRPSNFATKWATPLLFDRRSTPARPLVRPFTRFRSRWMACDPCARDRANSGHGPERRQDARIRPATRPAGRLLPGVAVRRQDLRPGFRQSSHDRRDRPNRRDPTDCAGRPPGSPTRLADDAPGIGEPGHPIGWYNPGSAGMTESLTKARHP